MRSGISDDKFQILKDVSARLLSRYLSWNVRQPTCLLDVKWLRVVNWTR